MIINTYKSLNNKKICLLGFGSENRALLDFLLKKKIDCDITVCDADLDIDKKNNFVIPGRRLGISFNRATEILRYAQNDKEVIGVHFRTGKNYDKNLSEFDIIFRIAGYPLHSFELQKAKKAGVEISSPTKLFFDLCPSKKIIGVTGTKGKGTTASLISHIIKKSGKKVWFGGNIGTSMFSFLDKIKSQDYVVLELSSFQLEDLHKSPWVAVITNFTPEHLAPADPKNPNYHKSLKEYWQAKANIFRWQGKDDYLISNLKTQGLKLKSKKILFGKSDLPSGLVGEYNKKNIAAAIEAVKILKIKDDIIRKAVKSFEGLPHRIEFVREYKGVKYFDNSFATTPEATIEDLKSFSEPIILFLGGADKGSDFKQLGKAIKEANVKTVILLDGKASPKIKKELEKNKFSKKRIKPAGSMAEAIKKAFQESAPGDIVLLSTACASFGMFKNYKERGDQFKSEVKNLK